ncbi:MAG: HDOD domain-containing protein [Gemmataceae bacterium]|nr:HDOD domain-containing protein [Gemmata sp.]MDW8197084.1 HDOD domain-containing protein [Gemmataceae bacterium]
MFFKAFTRLFRRQPAAVVIPTTELLRDLTKVESLPTLSDTSLRALQLIHNPHTTLADVTEVVRRDGILTAGILKLANSLAYRGKYPTEDVGKAILRLGLNGCRQVIAAVGVSSVFKHRWPHVEEACEVLLRHALFTAILASRLNKAAQLGFQGEEFTAGLLHDVGRIIIGTRVPHWFSQLEVLSFHEDAETLARERKWLRIDHCYVGAEFAKANRLPDSVTSVILHHHEPESEKRYPVLVALVAMADALANHVQRDHKVTNLRVEQLRGVGVLAQRVGTDACQALAEAIPTTVVGALRETRAMLRITPTS